MKIGDEIKMYFHGAGVVSEEMKKIIKFDKMSITIDDGDNGRKFSRISGKCLNDSNFGGFYRTIDKCFSGSELL